LWLLSWCAWLYDIVTRNRTISTKFGWFRSLYLQHVIVNWSVDWKSCSYWSEGYHTLCISRRLNFTLAQIVLKSACRTNCDVGLIFNYNILNLRSADSTSWYVHVIKPTWCTKFSVQSITIPLPLHDCQLASWQSTEMYNTNQLSHIYIVTSWW
jgi:hypothetical protein